MVDNVRGNACLLCGSPGRDRCLCPDCLRDLPWLGPACHGCALPLPEPPVDQWSLAEAHGHRCHDCQQRPPAWQQACAVFRYDFPIDRLVAALKYHGRLTLADHFGQLLAERATPDCLPDLIVPVPIHPRRLRQRGCNQAALLARVIARQLRRPCDPYSLCRIRDTAMQKTLDPQARKDNLHNAFAWHGPALRNQRIALVDDVLTTGATAACISDILQRAGAGDIMVWAVARTLPP